MKKIIVLCIAFALVLGAFSGVLADDKVTLTFAETMTSPERTLVLQNAIEAFEAAHPDISVELVSPPYESAETKVASMLAAGQEVDIVEHLVVAIGLAKMRSLKHNLAAVRRRRKLEMNALGRHLVNLHLLHLFKHFETRLHLLRLGGLVTETFYKSLCWLVSEAICDARRSCICTTYSE